MRFPPATRQPKSVRNSYWMSTVVLDPDLGLDKRELGAALLKNGVDSRPFFHPLSSLPAYAGESSAKDARDRNPVSYSICPYGLNLPSALVLTEQDVDFVCRALTRVLTERTP